MMGWEDDWEDGLGGGDRTTGESNDGTSHTHHSPHHTQTPHTDTTHTMHTHHTPHHTYQRVHAADGKRGGRTEAEEDPVEEAEDDDGISVFPVCQHKCGNEDADGSHSSLEGDQLFHVDSHVSQLLHPLPLPASRLPRSPIARRQHRHPPEHRDKCKVDAVRVRCEVVVMTTFPPQQNEELGWVVG